MGHEKTRATTITWDSFLQVCFAAFLTTNERCSLFLFEATVEMVHHFAFCCDPLNFDGNFTLLFTLQVNTELNPFVFFPRCVVSV